MQPNHRKRQPVQILLVEDNRDDEELTLLTLSENAIVNDIVVVRDGAEALDYLFGIDAASQPPKLPHLILLDIKLPKVDGIEILRRVKQNERTRRIPVVMLTSSSEEPDVQRSYDLGANSYIVKPVDFNQFKETIRQLGFYWQVLNILPEE